MNTTTNIRAGARGTIDPDGQTVPHDGAGLDPHG